MTSVGGSFFFFWGGGVITTPVGHCLIIDPCDEKEKHIEAPLSTAKSTREQSCSVCEFKLRLAV